jgi:hypothetical protein
MSSHITIDDCSSDLSSPPASPSSSRPRSRTPESSASSATVHEGEQADSKRFSKPKTPKKKGPGRRRNNPDAPRWAIEDQFKKTKDPNERERLSAELAVHKKAEKAVANAKAKAKRAAEKAEKADSKAKSEPKSAPKAKPKSAPKAKPKSAPKKKAPAALRTQRKPPSKTKPAPAPAPTKQIKHLPKRGTFQGRLRKGRDYLTAHNKRTLSANAELADLDCQGEVMQYDDDTEVEGDSEGPDEEGSGLVEARARLEDEGEEDDEEDDEEEDEDEGEELYDLFDPTMPWLDGCWEVAWGWPKRRDEDDDEHPNRGSDGGWQGGLCA